MRLPTRVRVGKEEFDLEEMDSEELLALKIYIDEAVTKINLQLDHARAKRADTGEYADREWYAKAQYAKRCMGRASQVVQATMGARKRARSKTVAQKFVQIAKRELEANVFGCIMGEALEE